MPPRPRLLALGLLALAATSPTLAQTAGGSREDYARAAALAGRYRGKLVGAVVRPEWVSPSAFWYRATLAGGERRYWLVDAARAEKRPLFDHARVAATLAKALGRPVDERSIPIDRLEPANGRFLLMIAGEPRLWTLDPATGDISETPAGEASPFHLKPLDGPRPSRSGGRDSSITFINRTQESVKMFWIDAEGHRKPYDRLAPGATAGQHTFAGHVWVAVGHDGRDLAVFEAAARPSIAVIEAPAPRNPSAEESDDAADGWEAPGDAGPPPDAAGPRFEAFIRDHNVFARDASSGEEFRLSDDGTAEDPYDGRFFWAPDGVHLAAVRTRRGGDRKVRYIESTPADQLEPKLHAYDYLKPGDPIPLSRPRLFDAAARTPLPVDEALFSNPWHAGDFRWEADSSRFTFLYNQRGHTVMRVIALNAATGAASALIDEACPTFFDYANKCFLRFTKKGEILWMTERSGWNHLELHDASGKLLNAITSGPWVVRSVEKVDEQKREITFRAMGIRPGQDPYHIHLARVNFDGTGLTILTEGDGTHEVVPSPGGEYLIDTYSRADLPPVTELRRAADGSLVLEVDRADDSALRAEGWRPPERFNAKGRDGATDIYGLIHRPGTFDPAKRYPVVEAIYAGPHDQHVPKAFREYAQALELAELGFIVVQIDGMGTNWRSKAFHDVAWKNLRDAGFPDRIAWLRAAAAAHPEMDLDNAGRGVGIYGGSAGGQNAMAALLWHGSFYKAAAADCGCHDNRMDKIWWNELWMSWPIGPWYQENSNAANAHLLPDGCRLQLTVGEADENVDPASTMQVVAGLIKANKDFELIVFPGGGHGSAESPYGRRRRQDFFVRSLMGVEPRHP